MSVGGNFTIPNTPGAFKRAEGSGTVGTPYVIYDVYGLQSIKDWLTSSFVLGGDIDAATTTNWSSGLNAGFDPIGGYERGSTFSGNFTGNNHTITGLYINTGDVIYDAAMIGYVTGGNISGVGMVDVNIVSVSYAAGLVGNLDGGGTITNCYVTGTVTGVTYVGGLCEWIENGTTISDSYSTATVTGAGIYVGGLIASTSSATIINCYATGNVTNTFDGESNTGGLVGQNSSTISNSYATGNVTGNGGANFIGGLVGYNSRTISNSYSTGNVNGNDSVGGLAGYNLLNIINSYCTGSVNGTDNVGGLVGLNGGSVSNSYYDSQTSGQSDTGKGDPHVTSWLQTLANFSGATWDISADTGHTWAINAGETYPYLQWKYSNNAHGISGTVYRDAGSNLIGANASIGLSIYGPTGNTTALASTGANSAYYFLVDGTELEDTYSLVVYINDNASGYRGNVVTKASNSGIVGLTLYGDNTVIARHEGASALTNTDFYNAKGATLTDTDVLYSVTGGNLTLGNATNPTASLLIWTGKTFAPGGNVTVSGNWTNNGTFTAGTYTVTFNSTTTGKTITSGSSNFYNVTFNGIGGEWTQQDDFYAVNNFVLSHGSFVSDPLRAFTVGNSFTINDDAINGYVNAIAIDGNGNIYIGGYFTNIGRFIFNNIAMWDGTKWNALADGLNADVKGLVLDGDNNLYAAGYFTATYGGGTVLNYAAKWNGSTWSALGTGLNNVAGAITKDTSNNIYVGGYLQLPTAKARL
jgi:hypothetical protein